MSEPGNVFVQEDELPASPPGAPDRETAALAEIEAQRELVRKAREAAAAAEQDRAAEIEAQRELIRKARAELEATKAAAAQAAAARDATRAAAAKVVSDAASGPKPPTPAKPAGLLSIQKQAADESALVSASVTPVRPAELWRAGGDTASPGGSPSKPAVLSEKPALAAKPSIPHSSSSGPPVHSTSGTGGDPEVSPHTPKQKTRRTSASQMRVLGGDLSELREQRRERSRTASKTDDIYRRATMRMRERNEAQRSKMIENYESLHQSKLTEDSAARREAADIRTQRQAERTRNLATAREQTRSRIAREIAARKSNEERRNNVVEAALKASSGGAGQVQGYHEMDYTDGHVYRGEWNNHGGRDGFGAMTLSDGSKYTGGFGFGLAGASEGLCNGLGVMIFPDGMRYEGEYSGNKPNGFGILVSSDGCKFEGQFANGSPSGFGLFTLADGSNGRPRLEGEWENGGCVRRCEVPEIVKEAQQVAARARYSAQA